MRSACKRGTKIGPKLRKPRRVYSKSARHGPPSVNAANLRRAWACSTGMGTDGMGTDGMDTGIPRNNRSRREDETAPDLLVRKAELFLQHPEDLRDRKTEAAR